MFASCGDDRVIQVGTAMPILKKWSTMLRIALWPLELGRGPTRSTDIMPHGCESVVPLMWVNGKSCSLDMQCSH